MNRNRRDDDLDFDINETVEALNRQGSFETDNSNENQCAQINWWAQHEGWGIFNDSKIQRDDELDIFASDDEAIEHVRKLAEAGSVLHKAAIEIHDDKERA